MSKTKEDISHKAWRKLCNQNWANVQGEIEQAMEEYSQSQLSEYKEKLKAEIHKGCFRSDKVFSVEDVLTLIDKI